MSLNLSSSDDDLSYGKLSKEEIKQYSMNENIRWSNSHLQESLDSTSSQEFDLDDSFKKILESRLVKLASESNEKEMEKNNVKHIDLTNKNAWEESNIEENNTMYTMSDETFAELEQECTNNSICYENKKDTLMTSGDKEIAAMHRLLNEFENAVDQTQLNDIEEPSGLWENTFLNKENTQKMSPVKMCGLLRPSTILEEDSFNITNGTESYKTTQSGFTTKNVDSNTETESFVTANNDTKLDSTTTTSNQSMNSETSIISEKSLESKNVIISSDSNLIDFNWTPQKKSIYDYPEYSSSSLTSNNITASTNSDGSYFLTTANNNNNTESYEPMVNDEIIDLSSSDELDDVPHVKIMNLNDNTLEDLSSLVDDSLNQNKQNNTTSMTVDSLEVDESSDRNNINLSREFNDTLEEMDYMMQQGLKLMAEKSKANHQVMEPIELNDKTLDHTPLQHYLDSPKTPNTVIKKSYKTNTTNSPTDTFKQNYNLKNVKTTPTSIIPPAFKKPPIHPISRIPQMRVNQLKKNNFDHVISPISMYIKKTPIVPNVQNCGTSRDIFNTKLCHIRDSNIFGANIKENVEEDLTCPLPRKAYITSERNHIIDERINQKIHGGDKINRLLENKSSPTVTKHQGRVKLDNYKKNTYESKYDDNSFADLSIMSGDVSVQVVKNADHF